MGLAMQAMDTDGHANVKVAPTRHACSGLPPPQCGGGSEGAPCKARWEADRLRLITAIHRPLVIAESIAHQLRSAGPERHAMEALVERGRQAAAAASGQAQVSQSRWNN